MLRNNRFRKLIRARACVRAHHIGGSLARVGDVCGCQSVRPDALSLARRQRAQCRPAGHRSTFPIPCSAYLSRRATVFVQNGHAAIIKVCKLPAEQRGVCPPSASARPGTCSPVETDALPFWGEPRAPTARGPSPEMALPCLHAPAGTGVRTATAEARPDHFTGITLFVHEC